MTQTANEPTGRQIGFLEKIELVTRWRRNRMMSPLKWLAYETGQTRLVPPPDRLYVESTNICNLSCIMCPTGRKEQVRKKGYMDFDLFKSIVDQMAPWVQTTTLHIWGEPLMHPRLFDMIAYCRAQRPAQRDQHQRDLAERGAFQAHPGRRAGRDLPLPGWNAPGNLRADPGQCGLRKNQRQHPPLHCTEAGERPAATLHQSPDHRDGENDGRGGRVRQNLEGAGGRSHQRQTVRLMGRSGQ